MNTTQREITLIGGSSHGKEYILNDEFSVSMNKTLYPLPFDNDEIYTTCQLKSGQWIGYIAIEEEL